MSQFFGHFTTIIALWQKVLFQNITNTFINETHIKCSWFALGDIMLFCFPCNKWICRCLSTFKTQKFNKSVSDFFQMPIPFLISINTFIWDTSFSHHGEKETYFSFFAGVITLAAVPVACFLAAGVQFFTIAIYNHYFYLLRFVWFSSMLLYPRTDLNIMNIHLIYSILQWNNTFFCFLLPE